jgi:hypothetical protein
MLLTIHSRLPEQQAPPPPLLLILLLHVVQVVAVAAGKEYKISQMKQLLQDIGLESLVRKLVTRSAVKLMKHDPQPHS